MAKFHLLKIRTCIDKFRTEKCKVTFCIKYISLGALVCVLRGNTDHFSYVVLVKHNFPHIILTLHLPGQWKQDHTAQTLLNRDKPGLNRA